MQKIFLNAIFVIFIGWIFGICWLAVIQFNKKYPVTVLQLSGQFDYIAQDDIQSNLSDVLNNNLWLINVSEVKKKLYDHPWVREIFINKIWPNILKLELIQHTPIAKWNGKFMLTNSGKILPLINKNLNLPEFYAPFGQEQVLLEKYSILLEKLTPLGLFISKIEIMPDQNIQISLSNNINNTIIIKLGTIDLLDRINRFIIVYKKRLQPIISDISYVDLRYTNGVAVGWTHKGGN